MMQIINFIEQMKYVFCLKMVVAVGVDACITVALQATYAYTNLPKFNLLLLKYCQ